MAHKIDPQKCVSCDACRPVCPRNAISNSEAAKTYVIDPSLCNDCTNMPVPNPRCIPRCPVEAILPA